MCGDGVGRVSLGNAVQAGVGQVVLVGERLDLPDDRLNPHGGRRAGHPIGASGGILTTTPVHSMEGRDRDLGVVETTVGGGIATLCSR